MYIIFSVGVHVVPMECECFILLQYEYVMCMTDVYDMSNFNGMCIFVFLKGAWWGLSVRITSSFFVVVIMLFRMHTQFHCGCDHYSSFFSFF